METNESILNKGVVSLNDRKLMGKVKGVVIDCETCGISHFVVTSSTTGGALVLPFEKSISVGDTFMTIQDRADFLPTTDLMARGALDDNFDLVGLKVYSRVGDFLGEVKSFDIDTTNGNVAKIQLEQGSEYEHEDYVFFSREFVFVDDGHLTDADKRDGAVEEAVEAVPFAEPADEPIAVAEPVAYDLEPEPEPVAEPEPEPEPVVEEVEAEIVEETEEAAEAAEEIVEEAEAEAEAAVEEIVEEAEAAVEETVEEAAEVAEAAEEAVAEDDPDAVLKAFLSGKTINERVVSADGSFTIEAGETITAEVLDAAAAADALLLLTMSVDE